ncbi:MAG: ABC transporter permease [Chlorobium sp.]|nr:MAG: ABC transporter permease [Chlorobium sp.]
MRKATVLQKSNVAKKEKIATLLLGSSVIVLFLIGWELLFQFRVVNPLFISAPSRVVLALIAIIGDGSLAENLAISAKEFLFGYGAAILVGFPVGILLGWFKLIRDAFGPFIAAMQATPRIALMPLFIIWFGLGITSKIVVVLLSAIFPLIVNLQVAMSTIDNDLVHVSRAYGASRWQIFRSIALPTSLPFLVTGLRLAAGRGLLGVIVAEVFGGAEGIGYMIQYAGSTFQTDKVFAGVLVVALTGITLDFTLDRLGRHFDRWRGDAAVH